jgi:hypothetical protein
MANQKSKSNTLFHFTGNKNGTNGIDNIFDMLQNGFIISASRETDVLELFGYDIRVPMVCFCDIPLMRINDHIQNYGDYGIGISKKWAQKKGIEPIFYIRKGSLLLKQIKNIDKNRSLAPYFKVMYKNRKDFSKENEWRYIPNPITISNCYSEDMLNQMNLYCKDSVISYKDTIIKTNNDYLKIPEEEIRYVLVKKDNEKFNLIDRLKKVSFIKEKEILFSKILSIEQIKKDF